jgi:hypothetical protein
MLRYELLSATVIACRGEVGVGKNGRFRSAEAGSAVREGDEIVTEDNGFVSLRLPDRSVVSLPSRSQIGVRRLRRILLTGGIERLFGIVAGRARVIVTPVKNRDDSFRVSTPVAVSAVRGTEFRVRYDVESDRGATEVLEGRVSVATMGSKAKPTLTLAAGFGTIAMPSGVAESTPLLPAPTLQQPGRIQDGPALNFQVAPLDSAVAYHVQVASDAGLLDVAEEITAPAPSLVLPPVPDGIWFVRISAIDASGIEGLPSTYGFQRRFQRIKTGLDRRKAGRYREYLFRWVVEGAGARQYRFQLMKDRPDATPMIDEAGLTTDRFAVTDLPPGTYYWRLMSAMFVDGAAFPKWSPVERLTIARNE